MLAFGLNSVPLHNIVVVMGAFKSCLHFGELMLDPVQLHTGVFTGLAHFTDFFFFLAELQIYTLVFIRQLLSQSILKADHQYLEGRV